MNPFFRSLITLGLLAAGAQAAAQEPLQRQPGEDLAEAPAPPKYQVEVIVFAHSDANPAEELFDHERLPSGGGAETLAELPPIAVEAIDREALGLGRDVRTRTRPDEGRELAERPPIAIDPLEDFAGTDENLEPAADGLQLIEPLGARGFARGTQGPAFGFRLLRPDELMLTDDYARIERLGAYRALGHAGWLQEGLDVENAKPMNLSYLGITNPTGTILLRVTRFLHLTVDLEYQAERPGASGGVLPADPFGLDEFALKQRYKFRAERNAFRSGELQYLDHPMLGVLVLITPAPEEEVIEDDTDVLTPAA